MEGARSGGAIGHFRFVERGSPSFGIGSLDVGYHFVNRDKPPESIRFSARAWWALASRANYWFKPQSVSAPKGGFTVLAASCRSADAAQVEAAARRAKLVG